VFSQGRFNEKQIDDKEPDPPLPIIYFTSRFRFYSASFVYSGVYTAFYCAFILVGSIPALQPALKDLFGALDTSKLAASGTSGTDAAAPQIGTPAWAAMVIMVVAPTVPWVQNYEKTLRLWLRDFSSIPFKARQLADDIVHALLSASVQARAAERTSEDALAGTFERLERLQVALASGGQRSSAAYKRFFSENADILENTVEKFRSIQKEYEAIRLVRAMPGIKQEAEQLEIKAADVGATQSEFTAYRKQMTDLLHRYARLLICSLFYVEVEEYYVRG
jgi:hypothetical protein